MDGPFIYLLVEREWLARGVPVVKVGRSVQVGTRVRAYPNGSVVYAAHAVRDDKAAETDVLQAFRAAFPARTDVGSEYFQPDGEFKDACVKACRLLFETLITHLRLPDGQPDVIVARPLPLDIHAAVAAFLRDASADLDGARIPVDELMARFRAATPDAATTTTNQLTAALQPYDVRVERDGLQLRYAFPSVTPPAELDPNLAIVTQNLEKLVDFNPQRPESKRGCKYYAVLTEKDLVNTYIEMFGDAGRHQAHGVSRNAVKKLIEQAMALKGREVGTMQPWNVARGTQDNFKGYDRVAYVRVQCHPSQSCR